MSAPELLRDQNAHALIVVREGRTFLHAVALHWPPVRIVKLPRTERRYLRPLLYKGKPYPIARAVRRFKKAGRALGITKSAADALRALDNERRQA